jgi:tetratricopeptide (TPR) repeat protein
LNGIRLINWLEKKFQNKLIASAVIAAFSLLAYCNSFTAPFLLDDFGSISNNYAIQKLFDFAALWKFYANRIVLYFTLSINYFIHDNGVEGYHITNLLIHIFNGILLYIILKTLFKLPYFKDKLLSRYSSSISTIAAVLFVCHPMQINAVTYIIQRTASLAATFYFLAILFFIKYRVGDKLYQLLLTLLFTVLAMFTKENTITIPFMLLFIELLFFLKDGKTSWVKRIFIFLLLFATVPIIPGTNLLLKGHSQSDPGVSFKASTSMDRYQYFYTELNVMLLYIKLMFIPDKQNFDYSNDYPLSPTIWDNYSYVSFIVLALIAAFGIYTIKRNRLVFLGILWFFTGLAVESSFISIKDVYFEHRLYFPCAGFIIFLIGMAFYEKKPKLLPDTSAVFLTPASAEQVQDSSVELLPDTCSELATDISSELATDISSELLTESSSEILPYISSGPFPRQIERCRTRFLFRKPVLIFLVVSFILASIYTGLTIKRNYIYSDSIRLWSDAVAKAPGSDRAHSVLATGYLNMYNDKKKNTESLDLAEIEFKKAIDLYYSNSTAHCNLSKVYLLQEEYQNCIDEAKRALSLTKSEYADYNMGMAYKKLGKIDEALDAFKQGYTTNKRSSFILTALGDTYYDNGEYADAKKYYEEYIQYNSRFNTKAVKDKLKKIDEKLKSE